MRDGVEVPGSRQRYCSTNYVLLGLLLATNLAAPPRNCLVDERLHHLPAALHDDHHPAAVMA